MFYRMQQCPTITIEQLVEFTNADSRTRREIAYRCMNFGDRITQNPGEAQYYICAYLNGAISQSDLVSTRDRLEFTSDVNPSVHRRNRFSSYCIDRFLNNYADDLLPKDASVTHSQDEPIYVNGIKVIADIPLRLSVSTNSQTIDGGGICFRFDPMPLSTDHAEWIASLVFGFLNQVSTDETVRIKRGRCCLYNIADGRTYRAPRNALGRYKAAIRACDDFVECWQSLASVNSYRRATPRVFAHANALTAANQGVEQARTPADAIAL